MKRRTLSILVTAGPTREYIDPVRYISNDSSGKMGFEIARAARVRGHRVTLVHGPVALKAPPGVTTRAAVSARDMLAACRELWSKTDVLVMTAAVADFGPRKPARAKIKRLRELRTLELAATPDVVGTLTRGKRRDQIVIGFALEDRAGRQHAEEKLASKRLDAIVLNSPAAIGADASELSIYMGQEWEPWGRLSKSASARRIVRLAERLQGERGEAGWDGHTARR